MTSIHHQSSYLAVADRASAADQQLDSNCVRPNSGWSSDFTSKAQELRTHNSQQAKEAKKQKKKLDDGWPESEKGKDVDVKYIEERRRCEKISEERMNI